MPIGLNPKGVIVLRCVNEHALEGYESTTMRALTEWIFSLPAVQCPSNVPSRSAALALRAYHCRVCGYVEMYTPQPEPPDG